MPKEKEPAVQLWTITAEQYARFQPADSVVILSDGSDVGDVHPASAWSPVARSFFEGYRRVGTETYEMPSVVMSTLHTRTRAHR